MSLPIRRKTLPTISVSSCMALLNLGSSRVWKTRRWAHPMGKWVSCPILCNPMDYTIHGILPVSILEWVAFPFSRRSSRLRDWTQVFRIAGRFFTSWATREAPRWVMGTVKRISGWDKKSCLPHVVSPALSISYVQRYRFPQSSSFISSSRPKMVS